MSLSLYLSLFLLFLFYLNAIFISIDLCFILLQSLWISRTMTWPRSGSSWATMCRPSNPSRPPSSAFLGTGCFKEGVFSSIIFNILPCCRRDGTRKESKEGRTDEVRESARLLHGSLPSVPTAPSDIIATQRLSLLRLLVLYLYECIYFYIINIIDAPRDLKSLNNSNRKDFKLKYFISTFVHYLCI